MTPYTPSFSFSSAVLLRFSFFFFYQIAGNKECKKTYVPSPCVHACTVRVYHVCVCIRVICWCTCVFMCVCIRIYVNGRERVSCVFVFCVCVCLCVCVYASWIFLRSFVAFPKSVPLFIAFSTIAVEVAERFTTHIHTHACTLARTQVHMHTGSVESHVHTRVKTRKRVIETVRYLYIYI